MAPQPISGVPKRRPRLQPSQSTHFIQGGASEAGKSTFWSTNADDARSESSDDESSEDPELDEQNDDTWLEQQRDKLDRAAQARNRRDRGSDVSDISTDDEMEQGVEAPPKGGGRPGAGRPGRKLQVGKTVSFSAANIGQPGGGNVAGSDGADGDSSPQHFRPKQLAGTPAVDVALPADSDSAVAQASGADQAPPAWMFKANAGAPNTKYLQKLDEPKKDENKEFRGKFMMNSFIVAQNAMQSFNNGRKLKRKERKGKVANVEKYQTKVACTFCERVRKDDPPWYWSEARRRREAGEWCKREMLNDTSKVQAVGRLTLCPLHEEDMMEAEPNWLDVKSSVWASCKAADEERENAQKRDVFRRCISQTERGGRWVSSFPDQLPGCPGWVRLLTMLLITLAAVVVAMLPGMEAASHLDSTDSRAMGEALAYSFPLESVRAIAISIDRGEVILDVGGGAGASSADVAISVSHSVAPTAESSLPLLSTSVKLDESTGVLSIIGVWTGDVADAFAAPSAALQLQIPVDEDSSSTETLSVEVQIGTVGAGLGAQSSNDEAFSTPWQGFTAPVGDIVWNGETSMVFGRVSLATVEGSITVADLQAVEFSAVSGHGALISLKGTSAHILTVASGVAAIDAEVTATGLDFWPATARQGRIQWVTPHSTHAGGWLAMSTASAPSVRLSLGSGMGGKSGFAGATVVEVECGSRNGATCMIEVPGDATNRLCGSIVARSDGGAAASAASLLPDTGNNDVATMQDAYDGVLSAQRTASLVCSNAQTDGWIRGTVITHAGAILLRAK